MDVEDIKASYRRLMAEAGGTITVRRYTGTGPDRPKTDVTARARVVGYEPHELVGTIIQGDRKIIVMAEDLEDSAIDLPLVKGDKVVIRDVELEVMAADDNTRRVGSDLIAIELQVRGE